MLFRVATISIAVCALLAGTPGLLHAQRASEPITLNFANAEIEAVARTMAAITGRSIVVDPRVKGTINLTTERPVPPQAAYNQFLATLRLSGFTVVDAGGMLKVVPEADAKLQGGAVSVGPSGAGGSQIVTQIFRLNYETANNLVPILRPLISPNNTINVNPGNNSLVITDYADNLQRLGRIIAALDVSNATDVEVLPLQHALASDLAPVVQRLAETGGGGSTPVVAAGQGQADTSFRTTVIAEPRSNTLIVRASNPARLNLVRSLVARLDQPTSQNPAGNIYVVYLKNADAVKLATTLRAALAGMGTGAGAAGQSPLAASSTSTTGNATSATSSPATAALQPSAQPSTGGQIQADPATNSLIITAPEPQYRQLRAVIDRLDARRAQVFVESLIAEVNADKVAEFGIQWQNILGKEGNKTLGVLGTNFTIGGANIISLQAGAATGATLPSVGGNLGLVRNVNGTYILAALARFLETNADGNTLSTPNLLTLDNEEAKIVIGQNVPFVTGSFTNTGAGTGGTVNPFQTVERKDVGLTLRIKPQISENGTVRLQIFQEVSSVQASSINSPTGLITNKRSIESNVLVDDGAIVVLGGLLSDEYSGNEEKIPVAGDLPFFGNLFKAQTRSRKKTNLMVFLRPVVVRDAAQSDELSLDRYELMRIKQEAAQPKESAVVPVNTAPVLPLLRNTPRPTPAPVPAEAAPSAK
ncbi:MAG: type II secretion system protein GspD [Comamonadaceae bacterium]|nr:MAG: type II secretion system protein GspD [Comamonadaceae bacterium]